MPTHGRSALNSSFLPGMYAVRGFPGQRVALEGNTSYLPVSVKIDERVAPAWAEAMGTKTVDMVAQFVELDGLQEHANPQYTPIAVIGRVENILVYAGGTNREITLPFRFQAERQSDIENVRFRALWLDALKMPWIGSTDISNPPPPVVVTIGTHLTMRALVTSCVITWIGPYIPGTLEPMGANVDVTFTSVYAGNYRAASLAANRILGDAKPVVGGGSGSSSTGRPSDSVSRMTNNV